MVRIFSCRTYPRYVVRGVSALAFFRFSATKSRWLGLFMFSPMRHARIPAWLVSRFLTVVP